MATMKSMGAEYSDSIKPLLDQLPKASFWEDSIRYQWEGFWYAPQFLEAAIAIRAHFEARSDDVILTSSMKTGTTWLKALCHCITQQQSGTADDSESSDPLVKNHPHVSVQTLETNIYAGNPSPDLTGMPSPRLFHTHIPYNSLPDSIKNSQCKIVYITRNPKDTLVSMWHFFNTFRTPEQGPYPFDKAFKAFCDGVHPFGPFFDHVLQYWNESLKTPHKILFLKYEDLKRDSKAQVKKLASFLGRPVVNEEEVDKLLWSCSLERLKNMEVNQNGVISMLGIPKSSFFRLGVNGDWKNFFAPEMQECLDQITITRLAGSGLEFEL